jgi:hypothetical protein
MIEFTESAKAKIECMEMLHKFILDFNALTDERVILLPEHRASYISEICTYMMVSAKTYPEIIYPRISLLLSEFTIRMAQKDNPQWNSISKIFIIDNASKLVQGCITPPIQRAYNDLLKILEE